MFGSVISPPTKEDMKNDLFGEEIGVGGKNGHFMGVKRGWRIEYMAYS